MRRLQCRITIELLKKANTWYHMSEHWALIIVSSVESTAISSSLDTDPEIAEAGKVRVSFDFTKKSDDYLQQFDVNWNLKFVRFEGPFAWLDDVLLFLICWGLFFVTATGVRMLLYLNFKIFGSQVHSMLPFHHHACQCLNVSLIHCMAVPYSKKSCT